MSNYNKEYNQFTPSDASNMKWKITAKEFQPARVTNLNEFNHTYNHNNPYISMNSFNNQENKVTI